MSAEWKYTACPYDCPCTCSIKARHINGVVEMQPNTDNKWSRFVCAKGRRFIDRLYDPHRLTSPLLKGPSGFSRISWDDALGLWAEKISQSRAQYGPHSVMSLTGAGSMTFSKQLIPAFYSALGGCSNTKGSLCSTIGSSGLKESTCGFGVPYLSFEEMGKARGILFWGRNSFATQPNQTPFLFSFVNNGGETASIEIRRSETTDSCKQFWCVAPGGDWALAAWLCRELLERGADCKKWRGRCDNADKFISFINSINKNGLLAAAGIPDETAHEIYEWLASHAPVTHILGYGAQRYCHGDLQFRWIFALSVLLGGFENAAAGLSFSKDEGALFPVGLFERCENVRRFGVSSWPSEILTADPPVRVLNIMCCNPAQQTPDTAAVEKAFSAVDFKACSEMFMTKTAQLCDLVLPTSIYLEEEDWIGAYGHSYLSHNEKITEPRAGCKSDLQIYDELARKLGLDLDLSQLYAKMNDALLADSRLKSAGKNLYKWSEPCYWKLPESRALLPDRAPQQMMPPKGYIRLVTVHSDRYINGQSADAPACAKELVIRLSEHLCEKRGIATGDEVCVLSENGAGINMRAEADASLSPGTAWTYQGLPEINMLTSARPAPGKGAAYAECFVKVFKL